MFDKKLLIFCLIFGILLLSIGNVSAEEIDEASSLQGSNITVDTGSFSDLNDLINDDGVTNVTLEMDYTFNPDTDSDYVGGIGISKAITINGNGFTLDGNGEARIFDISSDVTLNNITFQNGCSANDRAGAINVYGANLILNDCILKDNYASESGGAIQCFDGEINIIRSTFMNNYAENLEGGVLHIDSDADVFIANSIFINNTASYNGGVIHAGYSGVTAINSTFTNNRARNGGVGAIDAKGVNVNNCTFVNNSAQGIAGAIAVCDEGNAIICNSYFENNHAEDDGGAIYLNTASSEIY
jgi:predicted outer membrane repeat protein